MRLFIAIISSLLFSFFSLNVEAQNLSTSTQIVIKVEAEEKPEVGVDLFFSARWGEWGVSSFILVKEFWGEALVGPTWAPIPELEIWLAPGLQQTSEGYEFRYSASVWTGINWFTFLGIIEWDHNGPDGVWYDLTAKFQVLDWLKVGVHSRRFTGLGLRLDVMIPSTPIDLWITYAPWDPEHETEANPTRFLFGGVLKF